MIGELFFRLAMHHDEVRPTKDDNYSRLNVHVDEQGNTTHVTYG